MVPLSLQDVAAAVRGVLVDVPDPAVEVTGPATVDSRHVESGALFACIVGDRVDGHDFVSEAVARGAVVALTTRAVGHPAILVDDVVEALGLLAHLLLARLPDLSVVAITGSSGKTSTKDLIAQVAPRWGPTVAPPGSFNNEIGLPLTVLRADASTRVLVLEMGARGIGHIAALTAVARPDISVVLNVGSAHLGEFGTVDAIAVAKGEIVEALRPDGVAVLNADDPRVAAMAQRTQASVVTFGRGPGATVRAEDVVNGAVGRWSFDLVTPEGRARVALQLVGEHQVANALAAAAVGRCLGLPVSDVAQVLSAAVPLSRWRMEVTERSDGVTVLNDAYNANPESVSAALNTLVDLAGGRRTWAVLGEMRELGDDHEQAHAAIGRLAVQLGVDRLVVVGHAAHPVHRAAGLQGSGAEDAVLVPDVDAAVDLLRREIAQGDVVLVKASRAAGLERVAAALLDDPAGERIGGDVT